MRAGYLHRQAFSDISPELPILLEQFVKVRPQDSKGTYPTEWNGCRQAQPRADTLLGMDDCCLHPCVPAVICLAEVFELQFVEPPEGKVTIAEHLEVLAFPIYLKGHPTLIVSLRIEGKVQHQTVPRGKMTSAAHHFKSFRKGVQGVGGQV
jgi:hypothetical protein